MQLLKSAPSYVRFQMHRKTGIHKLPPDFPQTQDDDPPAINAIRIDRMGIRIFARLSFNFISLFLLSCHCQGYFFYRRIFTRINSHDLASNITRIRSESFRTSSKSALINKIPQPCPLLRSWYRVHTGKPRCPDLWLDGLLLKVPGDFPFPWLR
mgnify:CR=1 FL=1